MTALVHTGILIGFFILVVFILQSDGHLYGSDGDWQSQHVELASYMRSLFYSKGQLFPDYGMNLGLGQNIYYISYYGLFSPVILFSYLLPFISMRTYIMVAAVVMMILSIILIYRWLRRHLEPLTAFAASVLFLFAAPVIFHTHHHIMFEIYLPFLILALEGMEKHLQGRGSLQLIVSTFLMIMCNYFFAVSACFCLGFYGLAVYLSRVDKLDLFAVFRGLGRLLRILLIPVIMAAVLWLPTLYVLIHGRAQTNETSSLASLLRPGFQADLFLYTYVSMGMTALFVVAVLWGVFAGHRGIRFFSVLFLVMLFWAMPVALLNGGMYLDGKVLIPFLPPAVMLVGRFIEASCRREYKYRHLLIAAGIFAVPAWITFQGLDVERMCFFADLCVTLLWIAVLTKQMRLHLSAVLVLIMALEMNVAVENSMDKMLDARTNPMDKYMKDAAVLVQKAEKEEPYLVRMGNAAERNRTVNHVFNAAYMTNGIYSSLNNPQYRLYYTQKSGNEISNRSNAIITTTQNPMNALLTGEKYIIGLRDQNPVTTFKKVAARKKVALYENAAAVPIGYVSPAGSFRPRYQPVGNGFTRVWNKLGKKKTADTWLMHPAKDTDVRVPISRSGHDRMIRITMRVDNSGYKRKETRRRMRLPEDGRRGEVGISIQGIRNVLSSPNWKYYNRNTSFTYTFMVPAGEDHLLLTLEKGKYTVSGVQCRSFDYEDYLSWRHQLQPWHVKKQKSYGNSMSGTITSARGGRMVIVIPWDAGYTFRVDGKQVPCQKTSDGWISLQLPAGTHRVSFVFHAPWKREALAISAAGCALAVGVAVAQKRRRKKMKKEQGGCHE
ncbi:MAG: YfhO family protein [Anaerovoracaceae bacterium]